VIEFDVFSWVSTDASSEMRILRLEHLKNSWTLSFFHPFKNYEESIQLLDAYSTEEVIVFRLSTTIPGLFITPISVSLHDGFELLLFVYPHNVSIDIITTFSKN
jgi:galactose-1-phosphate uridylyltransferase